MRLITLSKDKKTFGRIDTKVVRESMECSPYFQGVTRVETSEKTKRGSTPKTLTPRTISLNEYPLIARKVKGGDIFVVATAFVARPPVSRPGVRLVLLAEQDQHV